MTVEELGREIAKGLIATGIEGAFNSVSCSTAGDYPSMGCSQWEGDRGDNLLSMIPGGDNFIDRSYSSIVNAGELSALKELLDSEDGQKAQREMLAKDCEIYVQTLQEVPNLDDSRCMIYAGMWCPTSHYVVAKFLKNRAHRLNMRSMLALRDVFRDEYARAACVPANCYQGYANRAEITYQYVAGADLTTEYGVGWYGSYEWGK
ncbi:MAG: hypothetical protein IKN12_04895 [Selenomonadaceae bacterium]|nr:hypothetical protein [Selenomonadaceae bacterium]